MAQQRYELTGLYGIVDTQLVPSSELVNRVTAALRGGAQLIQYRDKSNDRNRRQKQVQALRDCCNSHRALFVINDDVELARWVGANGVHLGKDDLPLAEARERLGPGRIIGISCYDSLQRAYIAEREGADYVAFGRLFPSRTKPGSIRVTLDLIRQAKQQIQIPIAVIGGIQPNNAELALQAGANMLAVIHGLFGDSNCEAQAREFVALLEKYRRVPPLNDRRLIPLPLKLPDPGPGKAR